MGKLFVVPTPIGNLDDMTIRSIAVLKAVSIVAAEDTRVSKKLLKHFEIDTPLIPYHEFNKDRQTGYILDKLNENDVALISDAGTPGISDPGYELINQVIMRGGEIEVLPGATAFVPALVASGLPTDSFIFMGFLPKKKSQVMKILAGVADQPKTLIFYESPHRILETLKMVKEAFGERKVCVAREISKKFEEFYRLDVDEAIAYFEEHKVLGEVVILVGGASKKEKFWTKTDLSELLEQRLATDEPVSSVVRDLVEITGFKKSEIYKMALDMKKDV